MFIAARKEDFRVTTEDQQIHVQLHSQEPSLLQLTMIQQLRKHSNQKLMNQ